MKVLWKSEDEVKYILSDMNYGDVFKFCEDYERFDNRSEHIFMRVQYVLEEGYITVIDLNGGAISKHATTTPVMKADAHIVVERLHGRYGE